MDQSFQEKYLIMRERKLMLSPVYWNVIYQTSSKTRRLYNVALNKVWMYFDRNGNQKSIYLKSDWEKKGKYIADKLLKDNSYFKKIKKSINQETFRVEEFLKRIKKIDLSKLDFKNLVSLANRIKNLCLNYDSANVFIWFLAGDEFQKKIYEIIKIPEKEFLLLITPEEQTAVSQLEYKLLKYANLIKKRRDNLKSLSQKLADKYGWIPFGYDGPEYWTKDYFIKELNKNLKKKDLDKEIKKIEALSKQNLRKRNKIRKKYKLNNRQMDLINKAQLMAQWTDERKKYTFQLFYHYSRILWELEKRFDIPYRNLKYLLTEELVHLEKNKKDLLNISKKRIKGDFMICGQKGRVNFVPEKEKNKILNEIEKQFAKIDLIQGTVASKGPKSIYRGKVKVILSPQENKKIKQNEFLVATMTTPDYIAAMRKAVGFITDEGGVTCHAAIVAREMKKPCIIGTKIATKVLKDGDLVEVDANKGVIRKIK